MNGVIAIPDSSEYTASKHAVSSVREAESVIGAAVGIPPACSADGLRESAAMSRTTRRRPDRSVPSSRRSQTAAADQGVPFASSRTGAVSRKHCPPGTVREPS
ncbi:MULTISPECIES: hypothetical protein [Streptomyces]|uniref:hypothetical protein n=1 Tax=Streptomyces TaxID=1883 RepID=UPI00374DFE07